MNKYDLNHVVAHHAKMSDAELTDTYKAAWNTYYTDDHIRTILRRAAAHPKGRAKTALSTILWFRLMIAFEGVHPLEGGAFRLKFRRDRRFGMKIENPLVFYPRYGLEILRKATGYFRMWRRAGTIMKEVLADPNRLAYRDLAITPPEESDFDSLELYSATDGGNAALARKRAEDDARAKTAATVTAKLAAE